ncbi:hypothetical protein DFA_11961 [Cavenderia fasciculata]|uniref:RGS domain-containing protein n=1 Tax=Cavenderia fasciculata TaxID=261658 RepID=F4QEY5_CACFS|nr:uncharacterized protein DFA_11961 [Cavenderia fasciculata]EGG14192.1 hypothetical protein DFA_11961 [Cavenderia fasciculata]|eukprot:XP_004350900.1 hypothetical protein DFA_11961 [Cavenderia fasciculata]
MSTKSKSTASTPATTVKEKKMKKMGTSNKKAQSISPSPSNNSLSDTFVEPTNGDANESPESQEQQREISVPNSQQSDTSSIIATPSPVTGGDSGSTTSSNLVTPVIQRRNKEPQSPAEESTSSNNKRNSGGNCSSDHASVARADSFSGADINVNSSTSSIVEKVTRESGEAGDDDQELKNYLIASNIFEKYLSPSSPIEVNLDYRTFIDISKKIQNRQIFQKLYDRAIKEIFDVINNDSYHRFKATPLFKSLVVQADHLETLPPQEEPTSTTSEPNNEKKQKRNYLVVLVKK